MARNSLLPAFTDNVSNAWNWLTGNQGQAVENEAPAIAADEESDAPAVPTVLPPPNELRKAVSLHDALHLVRVEAMQTVTDKAKVAYDKVQSTSTKNTTINNLLKEINAHTTKEGTLKVESDKLKNLLSEGKKLGIDIDPSKTNYSKDDVRKLTQAIDLVGRNLETDLKLHVNEMQECTHQRNLFYQEVRSMLDKLVELARKILANVAGR